jgi:hypothetical protein
MNRIKYVVFMSRHDANRRVITSLTGPHFQPTMSAMASDWFIGFPTTVTLCNLELSVGLPIPN